MDNRTNLPASRRSNIRKHAAAGRLIRRSVSATWESLESRQMLSSTYLVNGTQLTTTPGGGSATTSTFSSPLTLSGSGNTVTFENYSGQATINGATGNDTITDYAGSGGNLTIRDLSFTTPDQLQVLAPTTSAANVTANASEITLTTGDTVHFDSSVGSVSLNGQLFSNGDALTVSGSGGNTIAIGASTVSLGGGAPTIYYSTFNGITVNGGASDNFALAGDSIPTTLNAGSGNVNFNVSTNSVALAINGGSGTDGYTVYSNSGQLTATGGTGNSNFTVYGSSSSMTLNGGGGINSYTIQSNSASLNINGGGTANTLTINGNSSSITARGGSGSTDSFTVNTTTGQVALDGGAGSATTYLIAAPTIAAVTVTGSSTGTNALTFDGTSLNNAFSITTNAVSAGSGASVGFSHLTSLVVNGIGGNDSYLINGDTVATTLNGGAGNDTFNIQSESGGLLVNTGSGASNVNLGSNAPLGSGNTVTGITGAVTVSGDNSDTLSLNDAADTTARSATLTSTGLTGLGFAGLNYSGLATINVKLGSGGNTVAINSTTLGVITNFNTGAGTNTVYVGSTNSASGVMSGVAGALNLTGGGSDTLLLNDAGDTTSQTATLTPSSVTALNSAPISYAGVSNLTIDLGTAGNSFSIANTHAGTSVSVNGGAGPDTLKIVADASPVSLTTGGGTDTVLVQSINAATSVVSSGNSTIDVGSNAPASSGMLSGIVAGLTVTGASTDTLNVDDSGDVSTTASGSLSGTALHGLGMGSSGINYSGLSALNLALGSGGTTFNISNTAVGTPTNVTGGASADTINLINDASPTTITSGAGNDRVNLQGISAATTINTGSGNDVVYAGNNAPVSPSATSTIAATLTVNGGGNTTLDLDYTGDSTARSATITATAVTGISGGSGVVYSGLSALTVSLGSGGNTVQVDNTASAVITSINTGSGNDVTFVLATTGTTNINDGGGNNLVRVASNAPQGYGVTTNLAGALNVTGNTSGVDSLVIEDGNDALPRLATLTPTTITGISPAMISYVGFNNLTLYLGTANNQLTVSNTMTGSTGIITGNGDNSIILQHDSGRVQIEAANSSIAVENIAADTEVDSMSPNQITVGDPVIGGSTLAGITATLDLGGMSPSVVTVDDSADSVAKSATLTDTAITGFSSGEIDYDGNSGSSLNLNLGSGGDTLAVDSTIVPTTITGGSGADTVNIQSDSASLAVAPGGGHNTVNIGSNAPAAGGVLSSINSAVTVTGTGIDTLNLDDSGDTTTRNAATLTGSTVTGLGAATINYSGLTTLKLTMGNAVDTLNVTGTAAGTASTVHTGTTGSTLDVQSTAGTLTVLSGAADAVNIGSSAPASSLLSSISANVTVTGLGHDTLTADDSADLASATGSLSTTALTGLGMAGSITYSGVTQLNLNLGSGNDAFTITGTSAVTDLTATGDNTIGVTGTSSATSINSSGTIIVGSVNTSGGTVTGITGVVTVSGDGTDQLILQDVSDVASRVGTLSSTQLILGPTTVNYTGAGSLAVNLGGGGDSFTINSTAATTPVTMNGGSGTDTLNIGTDSSATTINTGSATSVINIGTTAHVIDGLTALLTVTGSGSNTLNVNDTGSMISKTGSLSSNAITGLNTAGIDYSGFGVVNLLLGSGGNTLGVISTFDTTLTNVNSGSGPATVNVANTGGTTNISTGAANNTVNIADTGALTTIIDGTGSDTINVGSNAPSVNSVTSNINSLLTITGNAAQDDILNLLDASDAGARTAVLNSTSMTGISPAAIDFTGISAMNLYMGTGNSSLTVNGTIALGTLINTSTGHDAITVSQANGPTQVQTGNSTVLVQRINSTTEIDSLAPNQITVGLSVTGGRMLSGINSSLFLDGVSGSTATIDDSADTAAKTGALSGITLSGLSVGGINYVGLASLDVKQGTAADTINITSTATGTPTTINGGGGNDTVNIMSDSATLTYAPVGGTNAINIGSNAPASDGVLSGISNPVTITGTGRDLLTVDDSGDTTARNGETISSTSVSGFGAAAINYTGVAVLHIVTGSAADTLIVAGTAASTSTSMQTGTTGSTIDVRSTSGALAINSGAADVINVGSNAPAGSTLNTLSGGVTVAGLGNDTLNVLDNADTTNASATLSAIALTGLGASGAIAYTGVSHLNLHLGSGADALTINGTSANTTLTGSGNSSIHIAATTAPLSITSPGTITIGENVDSLTGAVTVTGNGDDQLILNDTADNASRSGTLSATQLTLGSANVSYTAIATLQVLLGNGGDGFTVGNTASTTPVTLNGGTGIDTLSVGSDSSSTTVIAGSANTVINVGNAGVLDGLTAPLSITGTGTNSLNIDDASSTVTKTGSLTTTELVGLNTAGITYGGIGELGIALGSGGDTFDVESAATPSTLTAGAGGDHITLSGTDETTNALSAPLTVDGSNTAELTLDDTASTTRKTLTLTGPTVTGLSPSPVTYSNLGALTIDLGSGSDMVNVQGSSAQTTINGNAAGQTFDVTPASLSAPVTLAGSGTDPLVLDDSVDAAARTVTFAVGQISGLGAPINYTGMQSLTATLGSNGDTAIVTGVDAAVPTTIDGGPGANTANINVTGDLPGELTFNRFQTGAVSVGGNVTGTISTDGSFSSVNLGNLAGTLNVAGSVSSTRITENLSGALNVSGGLPTVTIGGNLSGTLTTPLSVGSLAITGNLSGAISVADNLASLHVEGGFTSSGTLNVGGALKLLEVDGTDAGQSHVGSLQGLVESDVTPAADGTIFSLTQGGVTRSIQELSANEAAGLAGTTFSVFYDDSTSVPQAVVLVNGGVSSQRFDLLLNAPAGSVFSLSRLDSLGNAATEVRNVVIDGSLLNAVTPAEASYFGYAANSAGGVQLPNDNLAAVSARDVMAPQSIAAKSIQGIGYAQLTGSQGEPHPGNRIAVSAFKEKLLMSTLAINPATHKPYATVLTPTETLLVPTGTAANPTGLYAGHASGVALDTNGIIVWDHDATNSANASVTFSNARINGEQVVNLLAWQGTGGSVQTLRVIQNITSTGALGDVMLGAGKAEVLSSITAPSVEGTIDLYGGKLKGTIQTTAGDLGAADGSTRIELAMASGSQIISRGNLFSSVSVAGNLTGTIAAADDISGDIVVTGLGNSTGSVIAFGNVTGPVSIAGSFSGQMAAGGAAGISGDVSINKGLLKGGSVVSNGNVGDKASGTVLTAQFVRGLIVAEGSVQLKLPHPANNLPVVQSSGGSTDNTASTLEAVWSESGRPLSIDEGPEDLAGLKTLKSRLKSLSVSSTGSLT
jgi:hypothetical protein